VGIYGELSVIAALPGVLEGRAKDWFSCHSMPMDQMKTVDGWIQALKDEFKVNTAVARDKANNRKYNSADESVLKYFYSKVELLRTVREDMARDVMIDEIWLGLLASFRMSLDYEEVKRMELHEFRRLLGQKDLSYRKTLKYSRKD
jgi:hypothetical protein